MIRRPPRSTLDRSSAASDVYKRQDLSLADGKGANLEKVQAAGALFISGNFEGAKFKGAEPVSYTHLRAHETVLDLVCRLLLEKKKKKKKTKKKNL